MQKHLPKLPSVGNDGRFYLESDGYTLPVDISANPMLAEKLEIGSVIDVAGVCVMDIENWRPNLVFPHIKKVMIVTRTPDDIVVMDLVMPRKDGIAATTEIQERLPESKVLILTTFSSSENIARALKAGASGAQYLSADIEHLLEDDPPLPDLSPRQIEILNSIARGLTNREISTQLCISLESVKSHIKIILEKLGAASRTEAASIAQRKHLLESGEGLSP